MKNKILAFVLMLSAFCSSIIAQTLSVSSMTIESYDRKDFCVSINGATDITALQFNLSLPEGFTVDFIGQSGIKLGEATNDHTLSVKTLENGDLLVVLYNMEFNTFTDGELVRIPFEACEEEGTYQGRLYNVRMSTADAVSHQLEDVVYEAKVIIPVKRVILDKEVLTMVVGETETLVANVRPDDATDKTVTWSTSDASVATVADGVVTALAAGTATITAKAGDKEATCVVTVEKKVIAVSGIALDQTAATLTEGETLTLKATVSPDDATDKTVTWTSSNESVATVDNNGVVTAVAAGTATITATAGDYSATCVVTVESKVVDGIDNSEIINHKSEIIYDLTGRRVTHPTKGIYIVGGKKVVIK